MFNVILVEPQIPQNTGNIARLCAATDMQLIIAGRPGFLMTDKYLKRAGMDYWEYAHIRQEPDLDAFFTSLDMQRSYLLTTKAKTPYTQINPQPGDYFLFGREDAGLSERLLNAHPTACFTIPMKNPQARSLNLATSVGIVMFHALSLYDFGF
ncbi:MAG: tRNA (cytidine(34)-2'-O)-methyltransferase [Chloroflexota bacterium]